jgi:hypothetical protein
LVLVLAIDSRKAYAYRMNHISSTINRAYSLALTGEYVSLTAIEQHMKAEHSFASEDCLRDRTLRHGLNKLCVSARRKISRSRKEAAKS